MLEPRVYDEDGCAADSGVGGRETVSQELNGRIRLTVGVVASLKEEEGQPTKKPSQDVVKCRDRKTQDDQVFQ